MAMSIEAFVDFPGTSFRSIEEFKQFRGNNRDLFDERYRREQSIGVNSATLSTKGFCGPCLRVTKFLSPTAAGEKTVDGRLVPHWRLAQTCDCSFGLTSYERALLHMALPRLGSSSWSRGGILGRGDRIARYLSGRYPSFALWPRFLRDEEGTLTLPVPIQSQHIILAADELPHFPSLDQVLAAVAHSLMPGGAFLFSTPFDVEAQETMTSPVVEAQPMSVRAVFSSHPVHRLGWDLIGRLREAGFNDAAGYCYWSEELGYLGPYNMIFLAFR
jgi:hypothetical protein